MDWKIEVVTVPVLDVDLAKDFYEEKVGFTVDIDLTVGDGIRLVQLTPPGSACSIHLGTTTTEMEPGSVDSLFLVVTDMRKARAELLGRGVEVGEAMVFDDGNYRPAIEDEHLDHVGCFFFSDPDGNGWCVQQVPKEVEMIATSITDVLAGIAVADHNESIAWYTRLLGRPADRSPMDGLAEWQVTGTGAIQLIRAADRAGGNLLTLAVDDLEAYVAVLSERGLSPGEISTGMVSRFASITDPEGNTITLVELLDADD